MAKPSNHSPHPWGKSPWTRIRYVTVAPGETISVTDSSIPRSPLRNVPIGVPLQPEPRGRWIRDASTESSGGKAEVGVHDLQRGGVLAGSHGLKGQHPHIVQACVPLLDI